MCLSIYMRDLYGAKNKNWNEQNVIEQNVNEKTVFKTVNFDGKIYFEKKSILMKNPKSMRKSLS